MALAGSVPRVLLDRYELRQLAGRGGMGEVWLGWDRRLQRDVAVKLLLPALAAEPSFRERFAREARSGTLDHPNVVSVYDVDQDGDTPFIVMERLPGPSLDARLVDGPLSHDEVQRLAADMLAGLGAAHQEGIVHRDVKPGNLIRSAGGRWKVGDFGVAKDLASTAHLTLVGVPVGTPAYLAPEQLDGHPATPASDLWAAAVVLREALTGRRPFPGDDPIAVAHAVRHVPLPPLATVRPDVAPHVAAALDRALSADPAGRFASAGALLAAIEGRPSAATAARPVAAPAPAPATEPAAAPPVPQVADPRGTDRSKAVRAGAIAVIVLCALALLFLVGVAIGLVMIGDGGDTDDEPVPVSTAVSTTAPFETTKPPTTTAADGGITPPPSSRPDERPTSTTTPLDEGSPVSPGSR